MAHADPIDSRADPLVRSEPVAEREVFGTVALLRAGPDETLEEVERLSLPYRLFCSGTLITPTTVLTAGHCVQTCPEGDCFCGEDGCQAVSSSSIYVAAGMTDFESVWDSDLVHVSNIVLHEDYTDLQSLDFNCDESYCPGFAWNSNDLALLHLASPITSLRPVALYPEERILELAGTDTVGLAQGYGLTLPPESEALLPQDSYLSRLNQGLSQIVQTNENELLTTRSEENVAVCYGDSGGPLYVVEGDTPMLAGVASRLRGDARECEGGGVYALAPAYTEWIHDNVTGEIPSATGNGGGCSASQANATHDTVALLIAIALLLIARRRGVTACATVCVLATLGCGSDGDASFCTEQYDPLGFFCSDDDERTDLQSAEERARAEVPEDALLWLISSTPNGALSPDGRDYYWSLTYYLPGVTEPPGATLVTINASAADTHAFEPYVSEMVCIPTEPMPVFDSRRLVHDGIRFLEAQGETVSLLDGGNLVIRQWHPCGWDAPYHNYLRYRGKNAVFDTEGTFRSLVDAFP